MRSRPWLVFLSVAFCVSGCGRVPSATNIDVPFTSQAPTGNWSEPWQNACEETSIYMVNSFYANDPIKRDEAIKNIKKIVDVKNKEFKVSEDESLQLISELINTLGFHWTTLIVENPTVEDLKKELANHRPIIVPVFAPDLHNKEYTEGGPDYHVMVLTGYDDATKEFIVNDPALTLHEGKGFRFGYDVFMKAIHDLNSKNYQAGKKAVLFTKQEANFNWLQAVSY